MSGVRVPSPTLPSNTLSESQLPSTLVGVKGSGLVVLFPTLAPGVSPTLPGCQPAVQTLKEVVRSPDKMAEYRKKLDQIQNAVGSLDSRSPKAIALNKTADL